MLETLHSHSNIIYSFVQYVFIELGTIHPSGIALVCRKLPSFYYLP